MKNKTASKQNREFIYNHERLFGFEKSLYPAMNGILNEQQSQIHQTIDLAEILFITSYPPRECGIATYSNDLIKALNNKFSKTLSIKVCALESGDESFKYSDEVKYVLKTSLAYKYEKLALKINKDDHIKIVLIQHEFGFFNKQKNSFLQLLKDITKPVIVVFHTVLPHPDANLKTEIQTIAASCNAIIVMTHNSARILMNDYDLKEEKISVIAHGTHLVTHLSREFLKKNMDTKGGRSLPRSVC